MCPSSAHVGLGFTRTGAPVVRVPSLARGAPAATRLAAGNIQCPHPSRSRRATDC